jgi:hypothetical protein
VWDLLLCAKHLFFAAMGHGRALTVRGRLAGVCEEVDRLPAVGSPRHDRASTPRWGGRRMFKRCVAGAS